MLGIVIGLGMFALAEGRLQIVDKSMESREFGLIKSIDY